MGRLVCLRHPTIWFVSWPKATRHVAIRGAISLSLVLVADIVTPCAVSLVSRCFVHCFEGCAELFFVYLGKDAEHW